MRRSASILTCCWILVHAWVGRADTNEVHHRFRFFIHPDVAAPLTTSEMGSRLEWYVHDLNTIFAKNTIRRFDFHPSADVTITDELDGLYGHYPGDLPESGNYEVWAIVEPSTFGFSYGGFMSFSTNGAGVAADLHWREVHDRVVLSDAPAGNPQAHDYWRQMNALVHEMAHVFGAGVGEYYSLAAVLDKTGVPPVQNIEFHIYEPESDPYWAQHPDYWNDPLLAWNLDLSLGELLEKVRFAHVSSAMINAGFRNGSPLSRHLPDLSATTVWLFTEGPHNPMANGIVRVWKVSARTDTADEIFNGLSDADGKVQFAWSGAPNNDDNLILIKAFPTSGAPKVRWYSLYEAQEQKVLFARDGLNIYMDFADPDSPPEVTAHRDAGNSILVTWPLNAVDYVLEQTGNLAAPNWQFVHEQPQTNGAGYTLRLPANDAKSLFRVRKP